ncbi:MAG TPA: hypothetical protein VEF91_03650, partial [Verrucomicrobiae bacterium]|nr:hypothetical protein [Verrucomicrobiae bacterium]
MRVNHYPQVASKTMNKKFIIFLLVTCFLFSIVLIPQISHCQTSTSSPTIAPTPATQGKTPISLLLIGAIVAVVAVVVVIMVFAFKKRENGKNPSGASSSGFEARIIKKFNGKPNDTSIGVSGFTEGGQPLLIKESAPVSLADVEGFTQVLINGKAQKGIIVAPDFDDAALDGKITAMDNGIELQMLRISELMNKRYSNRIKELASVPV